LSHETLLALTAVGLREEAQQKPKEEEQEATVGHGGDHEEFRSPRSYGIVGFCGTLMVVQ